MDLDDFGILTSNYNTGGAAYGDGDITGDGFVNFDDFSSFSLRLNEYNAESIADVIPEPATAVLLVVGLPMVCRRRH